MKTKAADKTVNRVSLGLKCSECLHFTRGPRRFERLCVQLGVEPFSPACDQFSPDQTVLAQVSLDHMRELATIANSLTQAQMRLFAYTFRNFDFIRKTGYTYGEDLVFSLDGRDFLDCYFRGVLIGASKDGRVCYLSSRLENLNKTNCFLSLPKTAVMNLEAFGKHRRKLIDKHKLQAPLPNKMSNKKSLLQLLTLSQDQIKLLRKQLEEKPETYDPPSIDSVPTSWLDDRQAGTLKRKKHVPEKFGVGRPSDKDADPSAPFTVDRYI